MRSDQEPLAEACDKAKTDSVKAQAEKGLPPAPPSGFSTISTQMSFANLAWLDAIPLLVLRSVFLIPGFQLLRTWLPVTTRLVTLSLWITMMAWPECLFDC